MQPIYIMINSCNKINILHLLGDSSSSFCILQKKNFLIINHHISS